MTSHDWDKFKECNTYFRKLGDINTQRLVDVFRNKLDQAENR